MRLSDWMRREYPEQLAERGKITDDETADLEPYDLLCLVGRKRGMLISGGEIDTLRAATMVLDEYRGGKIRENVFGSAGIDAMNHRFIFLTYQLIHGAAHPGRGRRG